MILLWEMPLSTGSHIRIYFLGKLPSPADLFDVKIRTMYRDEPTPAEVAEANALVDIRMKEDFDFDPIMGSMTQIKITPYAGANN